MDFRIFLAALGILAAGTNNGRVVTWKRVAPVTTQEDNESCWELQTPTSLETGDLLQIRVRIS